MTPEGGISQAIRIAASAAGHRLFRNNVGMLKDGNGRVVRFGLAVGSGDLIGWTKDGRFASIEVKSGRGRAGLAQVQWRDAVIAAGGVAAVVWSVDEALAVMDEPWVR
jgi:hypothetical protein